MAKASTRRTYTPEQREQAVAAYIEQGLSGAASSTGIPKQRISAWARKAGAVTVRSEKTAAATKAVEDQARLRRAELHGRLVEQAHDLLDLMKAPHEELKVLSQGKGEAQIVERVALQRAQASSLRDYSVSLGILVDKIRLEEGEATERIEQVNTTPKPEAIAKLRDELAAKRKAKAS